MFKFLKDFFNKKPNSVIEGELVFNASNHALIHASRPVNAETGEPMNEDELSQFRQMLNQHGIDCFEFEGTSLDDMKKAGIDKDLLLAAMLRSVGGQQ